MNVLLKASVVAALSAATVFAGPAAARTQLGTLECDVSAGAGMVIASQREMVCTFAPVRGGLRETYTGVVRKFGLDLGVTTGGRMLWIVYAATDDYPRAALGGRYVGASAEATLGAGLGANVLIGGSERSFALQPVSMQAQTGFNLAIGVTELELRPER
jgi:hypothetical protein